MVVRCFPGQNGADIYLKSNTFSWYMRQHPRFCVGGMRGDIAADDRAMTVGSLITRASHCGTLLAYIRVSFGQVEQDKLILKCCLGGLYRCSAMLTSQQ